MNRREFLKSLGALAGAAVLGFPIKRKKELPQYYVYCDEPPELVWTDSSTVRIASTWEPVTSKDLDAMLEGARCWNNSGDMWFYSNGAWHEWVDLSTNDVKWTEYLEYNA